MLLFCSVVELFVCLFFWLLHQSSTHSLTHSLYLSLTPPEQPKKSINVVCLMLFCMFACATLYPTTPPAFSSLYITYMLFRYHIFQFLLLYDNNINAKQTMFYFFYIFLHPVIYIICIYIVWIGPWSEFSTRSTRGRFFFSFFHIFLFYVLYDEGPDFYYISIDIILYFYYYRVNKSNKQSNKSMLICLKGKF